MSSSWCDGIADDVDDDDEAGGIKDLDPHRKGEINEQVSWELTVQYNNIFFIIIR